MNWSRAKTILIIALIITDVFLILTYGDFNFRSDGFKDHKALSEFLAEKNIYIDAEIIPKKNNDMPVLSVQNEEIDFDMINGLLFGNVKLWRVSEDKDEEYIREAELFLSELAEGGGVSKEMKQNAVLKAIERDGEDTKVIYKNVVNGITIEKSYFIITFKDKVMTNVECEWLSAVSFSNKKQKTISAAQALLLFITKMEDKKDTYIDSIEMIYWLDEASIVTQTTVADTAFPAWKIVYNGTDAAYIHAYEH